MKIVIVAGQARKVGKTSVVVGLIRGLRQFDWTAVKISTHSYGIPHSDDAAGSGGHPDFILTEETVPSAFTDTGRFLAAGARRAFWLRAGADHLNEALAALLSKLANERNIILESGSAMCILAEAVGIFVLDRSRREMKTNVPRAVAKSDAIAEIDSHQRATARCFRFPPGTRKFNLSRGSYSNPKLNRYILLRLQRMADA